VPQSTKPQAESPQSDLGSYTPEFITQLWTQLKLPITAGEFVNSDGESFKLPKSPTWTSNFGRSLCILDVDTRPIDGEGDILQGEPLMFSKLRPLSAGMMAHYNYGKRRPTSPSRTQYIYMQSVI
jgi:hypothetical protein